MASTLDSDTCHRDRSTAEVALVEEDGLTRSSLKL